MSFDFALALAFPLAATVAVVVVATAAAADSMTIHRCFELFPPPPLVPKLGRS